MKSGYEKNVVRYFFAIGLWTLAKISFLGLVTTIIIALQTVCFAEKRYQIEEPQFDLKASTTTFIPTGNEIFGQIYDASTVTAASRGKPLKNVEVTVNGLTQNYTDETNTDRNGEFKFSGLDGDDYLVTAKKQGFEASKYRVTLEDPGNGYGYGYNMEIYLYKTGKAPKNNSDIYGMTKNMKSGLVILIKGIKTKYSGRDETDEDGMFSFENLKADTYKIYLKKQKEKMVKIKLEKNMTYDFEVDW